MNTRKENLELAVVEVNGYISVDKAQSLEITPGKTLCIVSIIEILVLLCSICVH